MEEGYFLGYHSHTGTLLATTVGRQAVLWLQEASNDRSLVRCVVGQPARSAKGGVGIA